MTRKDWKKTSKSTWVKNNNYLSIETYTIHSRKKLGYIDTLYYVGVRGNKGIKYVSKYFKDKSNALRNASTYMRKH